jgi:hypothetical protein
MQDLHLYDSALYDAACGNNISKVKKIIEKMDGVNINWRRPTRPGWTPLHAAAHCGHVEVVRELLTNSRTDVNSQDIDGATPLILACQELRWNAILPRADHPTDRERRWAVARLLCLDERTDHDLTDHAGGSAMWFAVFFNNIQIVHMLMATARTLNLFRQGASQSLLDETGAPVSIRDLGARDRRMRDVIEAYISDPQKTRRELRVMLGLPDDRLAQSAEFFAIIVFICDGLLSESKQASRNQSRFLSVAKRVPLEIQMVLCNRACGIGADNIPGSARERGFGWLGACFATQRLI